MISTKAYKGQNDSKMYFSKTCNNVNLKHVTTKKKKNKKKNVALTKKKKKKKKKIP